MADDTTPSLARRLRRAAGLPDADAPSDAALLGRFADRRDEAAFAELVRRHGPMVLAVSRQVLGNAADADDAFQATFVVLARKPGPAARAGAVGG
ncbi:MAG: sigma-70 family RNA polymerase sigma factor, partial [Gemmataceae bacterium]|nr:sigma-70 family RNA polymerase sigma factor [Gemmataceae bacterium]